jgi:transketolase
MRATKEAYGWPEDSSFLVPPEVREHMQETLTRGKQLEAEWKNLFARYREEEPERSRQFKAALAGDLHEGWEQVLPRFETTDGPMATRSASGKVINSFAGRLPWIVSGSADLAPSNKNLITDSKYISKDDYGQRNIAWGIREHLMCADSSGLVVHEGVRPFAANFFVFTYYARPAIRLASLMRLPVIYVMTHDSIGVGEDGPTHQPVEHLASLRAVPNLTLIRPADANETAYAWRVALENREGPTMLVLSRQKLPVLDRQKLAAAEGVLKGGYILRPEKGSRPDIILIATGSEVSLALESADQLNEEGIDACVVSLPSWELFRTQSQEYRDTILPPKVTARLAIEAGATTGWRKWVGDKGDIIGIDRFGASAPAGELFRQFGFTVEDVVERAKRLL